MIAGLLVLIALILLFGAGVVRGWLLNLGGAILGLLLVFGIAAWVASFFSLGEDGIFFLAMGLVVVPVFALGLFVKLADSGMFDSRPAGADPISQATSPNRAQYVWDMFEHDIHTFSPGARETAEKLLASGDEQRLRQFCYEQVARHQRQGGQ